MNRIAFGLMRVMDSNYNDSKSERINQTSLLGLVFLKVGLYRQMLLKTVNLPAFVLREEKLSLGNRALKL